jgi:hypothetical protein
MPAVGEGKFVRVYGRQGKLDKYASNTSRVLASKRPPECEINV